MIYILKSIDIIINKFLLPKMKKDKKFAPAGNRTRVCSVAGNYLTTGPLVHVQFSPFSLYQFTPVSFLSFLFLYPPPLSLPSLSLHLPTQNNILELFSNLLPQTKHFQVFSIFQIIFYYFLTVIFNFVCFLTIDVYIILTLAKTTTSVHKMYRTVLDLRSICFILCIYSFSYTHFHSFSSSVLFAIVRMRRLHHAESAELTLAEHNNLLF